MFPKARSRASPSKLARRGAGWLLGAVALWLLGLGGGYLLLCLAGSWLLPGLLRPLRWLGVHYGDVPLYAGLLAAGLYVVRRRRARSDGVAQ